MRAWPPAVLLLLPLRQPFLALGALQGRCLLLTPLLLDRGLDAELLFRRLDVFFKRLNRARLSLGS